MKKIQRYWTEEEINFLKNNIGKLEYTEIGLVIDRTVKSIGAKAEELGLTNFKQLSQEKIDWLKENYSKLSKQELADGIGRSLESIKWYQRKFGLGKRPTPPKKWTKEDDLILINEYPYKENEELAALLNRTKQSIAGRAAKLNLKKQENVYNIGDKFNSWKLMSIPEKGYDNCLFADFECECGNRKNRKVSMIYNGYSKSCGECNSWNIEKPDNSYLTPTGNSKTVKTNTGNTMRVLECECVCKKIVWVSRTKYLKGEIKSCSCKKNEIVSKANRLTHGLANHNLYKRWVELNNLEKLDDSNTKLCIEWKESFESFYKWSIENNWEKGLVLYREDKEKVYSPDNCYWDAKRYHGKKTVRSWTDNETNYLISNYKEKTCAEIGIDIGRTTRAVRHKFSNLGLVKEPVTPTLLHIGDKVNLLTVLEEPYAILLKNNKNEWHVKCRCDCGNITDKLVTDVFYSVRKDCGCVGLEKARLRAVTRNTKYIDNTIIKHQLYRIWPRTKGDRCESWDNYENFYNDLIGSYDDKQTIYKLDENMPFSNNNIQWLNVIKGVSIAETSLMNWLNSFGYNFKANKEILKPKHIDMYDENLKIAIEYCGLHWHHENSPSPRLSKYHWNKYDECRKQGIRLITIFSDEWERKPRQVKNFLKSIIGIHDRRFFARKCVVKSIEKIVGDEFIDKNHIQGKKSNSRLFFGLFCNEELLGVTSFGLHHRNNEDFVLDRMCFLSGVQVVGGASKILKHAINEIKQTGIERIVSWSDNRWSEGNVYEKIGFELDAELPPDYSYIQISSPYERKSKQSMKKKNTKCPPDKKESEWALECGYSRIWDCGKKRYVIWLS